jgi:hypothetical protein
MMAVGLPGDKNKAGSSGIFAVVKIENKPVKYIVLSSAITWMVVAAACFILLQKILLSFRNSGHSLQAAREEAEAGGGALAFRAATSNAGKKAIKSGATAAWDSNA